MLRGDFVARNLLAACIQIDGVKGELLGAGDHFGCRFKIRTQLVDVPRLSGIVTRGLDTAGKLTVRILKTGNVVTLPALDTYRGLCNLFHGCVCVHAERRIQLFRSFIQLFVCHCFSLRLCNFLFNDCCGTPGTRRLFCAMYPHARLIPRSDQGICRMLHPMRLRLPYPAQILLHRRSCG